MSTQQSVPIAVVGSGCRFPGGSSNPSKLWDLLSKPRDVSTEISDDKFELQAYYHPKGSHHGTTNVHRSYVLDEDVRAFDATFFNISPNEADAMDPQQRLLMEVVYEALEAGGHTIEGLRGSDTAVYVGTMSVDYSDMILRDIDAVPTYFSTGVSRAVLSNRISYFFGWHGPSMTIDTACSSSMVALHQSVQSLRCGETRVAIAGGTELQLGPEQFIGESKMNLLSPDGRSRMWDADANGYARGDGVAAVVLKRLTDAIADGDHIECIIRGTGVNQDGKSSGLTVPSSAAQTSLIKETYARGGLDLSNPLDWPQFFEAHGTGTKAGDPREAEAINSCFGDLSISKNPLYVGSIKTIIGHTEGTAGLASVFKASLAVQHGFIPPNMLLNRLNPEVEEYCNNLLIPTTLTKWPVLADGVPRRVSVNSFGFGGTNGHAIVESYASPTPEVASLERPSAPFTPFTFSAVTVEALSSVLKDYAEFLKTHESINLRDLAWTLQTRRSALPHKAAFSASTTSDLVSKLEKHVADAKSPSAISVRSSSTKPCLLGVFTGQGAQWPTVGARLIESSAFVRERLAELDHSLATLPEPDRPSWRIADQLSAAKDQSRIGQAALSQPLCTAVQIILVDLLRSAGITFEAVIGHSSGEIGAAYAADYISAHDAIRIAHYRGFHAKLSQGPNGEKGAMLAVGTSWEDAEELLNRPEFKGRVKIACQNSASSLTLSGNADSVAEVKKAFDEQKKFARLLVVDTAYHSHHMIPCSDAYVSSLRACDIKVNHNRNSTCSWYSSVKSGELMQPSDELKDLYWRDNMVNAVLFADAVKSAASDKINLAVEVGPHPALKGPAQQTISDIRSPLPYTGVLQRNVNDVEAFAAGLGFIWTHLGTGAVDFHAYDKLVSSDQPSKLVIGLPSYPFNNSSTHWHESRLAKKVRLRGGAFHELLGVPSPNNTDRNLRWRNFLKPGEIPWLDGHHLQGQLVFPAAGYVVMALEAAKKLAGDKSVKVLELQDLEIGRAITFDEGANFAVETLTALSVDASSRQDSSFLEADFSVYACPNNGPTDMEMVSSGKVKIIYGDPSFDTLSTVPFDDTGLMNVDTDRFYSSLAGIGYGYEGSFKTLSAMKRRLNRASANVSSYGYGDDDTPLVIHPATLDTAFQAAFLAQMSPGDEQLWSMHVPTSIKCIRINPELCAALPSSSVKLPLNTILDGSEPISLRSNIDIFSEDGQQTLVQIEDLMMRPFSPAMALDDRSMFSNTQYGVALPDGALAARSERPSKQETQITELCERLLFSHLRSYQKNHSGPATENNEERQLQQDSLDRLSDIVESGRHPSIKKKWLDDTVSDLKAELSRYPENTDLKYISTICDSLPGFTQAQPNGSTTELQTEMLDKLHSAGVGFSRCNALLGRLVGQIAHRYPHTNILEIGGVTSTVTEEVVKSTDGKFSSYTFTSASKTTMERTASQLKKHGQKVSCKVFDIDQVPSSQDFKDHTYDIVVAANPLTTGLGKPETLQQLHKLLRPGGYLLFAEATGNVPLRVQAIASSLANKPLHADVVRRTSTIMWHNYLRKSGFSGVDAQTPVVGGTAWPFSVVVSQAINDKVEILRNPLNDRSGSTRLGDLVILGSDSLDTCRVAEEISRLAGRFCNNVTILTGLPSDEDDISPMSTFINLVDLDAPIFEDFTEQKLEGLKCLFELSKNVLWVTKNARTGEPYQCASVGFGRSIAYEYSHMSLQFLDLDNIGHVTARLIVESIQRLTAMDSWETSSMLWSKEPELYLKDEKLLVPRLIPNSDQNSRLNSLRRPVSKIVDSSRSNVTLEKSADGSMALFEQTDTLLPKDSEHCIRVSSSTLDTVNAGSGSWLYPAVGIDETTNSTMAILSTTNASRSISVAQAPVAIPQGQQSNLLGAIVSELLATSTLNAVPADSHILVHEPEFDQSFTDALVRQAAENNIQITFSTSSTKKKPSWINLPSLISGHALKKLIPTSLTHFIHLALSPSDLDASVGFVKHLPLGCKYMTAADLLGHDPLLSVGGRGSINNVLADAVKRAQLHLKSEASNVIMNVNEIERADTQKCLTTIIDWTVNTQFTVQVQPLDTHNLFSKDCVYLLAGLSPQVGESIAEWMSQNGAGHIYLTSRHAKSDEKWQSAMHEAGTNVQFLSMDITKKQDIERVVQNIEATGLRIAGVMNGAALFHDTPFSQMTLEQMNEVLMPKIDGAKHLDETFEDVDLDFFLVFSSLASVIGSSEQSNHTAADAYMSGLVKQRRQRGFAATSVELGRIAGIGRIERAGVTVVDELNKFGFMPLSESDLHHVLAEAIRAGSSKSDADPVMTTGCRSVSLNEDSPVAWLNNPRFSHKIIESADGDRADGNKKSSLAVRDQLALASTKEEALEVIKDCFANKLAIISELAADQIDHSIPLTELGIDSLVGVEVRGWFLKELKTDMPVLKVLGGGSITDLCQQALEKLPESLLPGLKATADAPQKDTASRVAPPKPASLPKPSQRRASDSKSGSRSPSGSSSSISSAGESSSVSSRSPPDTPATQLSRVPSIEDPSDVARKVSESPKMSQFVKSELISLPQSRFWFLNHLIEDKTAFNVALYYKITGNLRVGDLERAVRLVANRHEAYRTCFIADEERSDLAHQMVLPSSLVRMERKKINTMQDLEDEYAAMKSIPFDLSSGKLIRWILLTRSATENYLLFNYHHILMDGVALQIFLSDLEKAYQRQSLGGPPLQLPEFSRRQRTAIESGALSDQMTYWRDEFPDGHPVLPLLPMAQIGARTPMKSFDVHQVGCRLKPEVMARVKAMSRSNRCTPFHVYLATFQAMLHRFTGADDLTIGIADANRNEEGTMTTIGLMLNLLTLRFRPKPDQSFAQSIAESRDKTYKALENSAIPFDVLLQELNVPRSASYSPFFQAFFDYRQGTQEKQSFGNTMFELSGLHPGRTAYDMVLDITDNKDDSLILFRAQAGLYDKRATQLMLDTFVHLLETFAANTSLSIKEPPLYRSDELSEAVHVGRGRDLKSSWPETLPRRIDEVAAKNGEKTALKDGHGRVLTYATMIDRIEAISEALKQAGVGEGSRVLVFEDATADWPCSMLAIMRIGAVYVPLDLRNPLPRLADVAKSCEPKAILVDGTTIGDAPEVNVTAAEVVNVSQVSSAPSAHVANISRADAVAAILFSSGSTGKPKGIIVKHSGLRNEIEGYTTQWGLKDETVLQQSAFTFNHSSDQMYTGLTNGGTVCIVPWDKRGDPIEVSQMIADEGITYTKATPAEYAMWLDHGRSNLDRATKWRFAFGGGESLSHTFLKELAKTKLPNLRFFNSYGPTEISISSTKMEIAYREEQTENRIPCGFSLPNYAAYILDDQRKPVPVGMPGELWIGGAGVSLGYLNNKELTDHHFVPDPYATPEYVSQGWTTMYRTGDIAHLKEDGAMVFHNRVAGDTQVKIRGLRIELGDIESNIVQASSGNLREAAVTLRDGDPQFLVAHVVFAPNNQVKDKESYLQHLLDHLQLPQYMIPVMAIPLDRMPLTNHSKVDRKSLKAMPLPERAQSSKDNEELTETMLKLKQVWEKTLNVKDTGISITRSTNFFKIGGNSLLIVRLQSAMRSTFNVTVRLIDLLGANTLGDMAELIEESFSVDLIDWKKEIGLPDTTDLTPSSRNPLKSENKVLLVTGAGGFLGKHILAKLIERSDVAKIHCIGLREKPAGTPRELAVSSPKIVIHRGDLTEPWLGLSESLFWELAGEVDSILHMGAIRPFHDNYHTLRPNNIVPTKEVVRMAAARHIPIHYTSTAGVVPGEVAGSKAKSVADTPPPSDGSLGYMSTRWVCEQILDNATSKLQIPTTIHRFVPGATKDDEALEPAFEHFIEFVDRMSTMPDFSGTEGSFDMMPVGEAASTLATALTAAPKDAAKQATFLHHECRICLDIEKMMSFLEKRRGDRDFARMPGLRFLGSMKRLGIQYFIASQKIFMGTDSGQVIESKR